MRTTIEIPDDQYVALRSMAARRGLRGFSPLISEAVALLLAHEADAAIDEALGLLGALDDAEADVLEEHVASLRRLAARRSDDPGTPG